MEWWQEFPTGRVHIKTEKNVKKRTFKKQDKHIGKLLAPSKMHHMELVQLWQKRIHLREITS